MLYTKEYSAANLAIPAVLGAVSAEHLGFGFTVPEDGMDVLASFQGTIDPNGVDTTVSLGFEVLSAAGAVLHTGVLIGLTTADPALAPVKFDKSFKLAKGSYVLRLIGLVGGAGPEIDAASFPARLSVETKSNDALVGVGMTSKVFGAI